jgi:hypothetical protein
MTKPSTWCDVCGKLKEEANHWFRAAQVDEKPRRFLIVSWEDPAVANTAYLVSDGKPVKILELCGMGCAVKAMTKAMEQSG